jgi:F-type H+-transporting ATPase subunit g
MSTLQSYLSPLQNALRNPSSLMNRGQQVAETAAKNPETFLVRLRNMDSATWTQVGIVGAETIGFFSVGEMLGRFKIVGYRSGAAPSH